MLKLGSWLFDSASRRLLRGSTERKVSPKAAEILRALAETPGQVWSRDALLERVWSGVAVGEEVLTHAIAELRKALEDDPRAPRYIETIHKSGYRLLTDATLAANRTSNGLSLGGADVEVDAYSAYLNAVAWWDRDESNVAANLFESALQLHPDFALAHAGLAKALADTAIYREPDGDRRSGLFERALTHCRAAKFGDAPAEAYAAEGFVLALMGDLRPAKAQFGIALRLAPREPETHRLLGRAYFAEGDATSAATMFERAAMLHTEDIRSLVLAATARRKVGECGTAQVNIARALTRIDHVHAHAARHLCCRAQCLLQLGKTDEATTYLEHSEHESCYFLAGAYALAGERRRALDELEGAIAHGWRHGEWFEHDPSFDGLRYDPRFRRIVRMIRPSPA
jgi:DNA-binding winged helix-turn-helix (wHTH) protein